MRERIPWSKIAAGKSVLLVTLCIAVMTLSWPRPLDERLASLAWLWIGATIGWLMLTWLAGDLWRQPIACACFRRASVVILAVAALARILVILSGPPTLSDDLWRYIHDGAVMADAGNPYAVAPAEIRPNEAPVADVHTRINHPDLVTVYLPASQWVFAAASLGYEALPAAWQQADPLRDRWFRVVFVLFDLGTITGLLVILRLMNLSAWWAALYAWHPLPLIEIAGSGHQDPIGVFLLLAAVGCWIGLLRGGHHRVRPVLLGASLALSVLVKPVGLLLVPAVVTTLWRRPVDLMVAATSAIVSGCLVGLPFVFMKYGVDRLFETGDRFIEAWSFNGSIHPLLQSLLGTKSLADMACAAILLVTVLVLALRRPHPMRVALWVGVAGLLTTSTAHPWYALWMLPFCAVYPPASAWLLSLTLLGAYAALSRPGFSLPEWLPWAMYLPVFMLLMVDLRRPDPFMAPGSTHSAASPDPLPRSARES
jgi:hypothetical protein